MPRAEIASKQCVLTLTQLHAELAGKRLANKLEGERLCKAMIAVETVMKLLQPDINLRAISAKRRNKKNHWFRRGTLFRNVLDVLRTATAPITARQITDTLIANKGLKATRQQAADLQSAILAALRKRKGDVVLGEGHPAKWRLKEVAN